MEEPSSSRRFYAVNHNQDTPTPGKGTLIPYQKKNPPLVQKNLKQIDKYAKAALLPLAALVFLAAIGMLGLQTVSSVNTASIPQVAVSDYQTSEVKPLNYGIEVALTQPNFFVETREAFIEAGTTFIEVDLTAMQLRYFEEGVLTLSMKIEAKGEAGSWSQTPAGLYKVEFKKENYFSTIGQVYQPWTLFFQGNFFIHGWPHFADNTPVPDDFSGGGIRLENEEAERLFNLVKVDTPILVHEQPAGEDTFVYEPKIPELKTPHYLIADVQSSTVLASSDLTAVAPIASVTKIMTALVAAEFINLDSSVYVNEPTFVQSLIPRLGNRSKVSMYSLLQLLLVESSNEAAEVIASQLGQEEFVVKMNQKALSLGMVDTHFADPSGLSAENTASLSDLLRLAQYIYTNRSFIFELTANQNLPTAHIGGEFGELLNFNKVEDLDNFIGGKVGETIAAGQTSVTLHQISVKGSERVVAIIILGSEDRNKDVRELLRYAEERFGS
jgi:serine-type D-Ala-D-Ala endopeptidase (penicillin-binding protein 7)